MKTPSLFAFVILTVTGIQPFSLMDLAAEDWPQFRHDSARTGSTAEQLPEKLHLQWTRDFPAPQPAFPTEVRLRFDTTYEPVISGNSVFVPSMVNDSVAAFDVESGEEKWRFFTGGPVRFAPCVSGDGDGEKLYVASDDGFLYCLDSGDGSLLWKFRGLPADRKDRKLLGNQRLISLWPARGGPVVHGGAVFFAAGLWPGDGIFVHSLDAETGKVLWSNTDSHLLERVNVDHGVFSDAGVTPQGYLAILGGKLVVACGAQLPAMFDPKTGTLEPYTTGWGGRVGLPKGSWFVAGSGSYLSNSGDLYDLTRQNTEPEKRFKRDGDQDMPSLAYPGGYTRLLIDPVNQKTLGDFRRPVFTEETMFFRSRFAHLPGEKPDATGQGIVAYDLSSRGFGKRESIPAHRKDDHYPDEMGGVFRELWRYPSDLRVHLKAGSRLYLGGPGIIEAVELGASDGKPVSSWRAEIEGTPASVLAAAGKLIVVTEQGRLYTFGGEERPAPVTYPVLRAPLNPAGESLDQTTSDLIEDIGSKEGIALLAGIGSGRLASELLRHSKLRLIVIDPDPEKVALLRQRMFAAGLYGTRIAVHAGDPLTFPLPPYFADLVVSEDESVFGEAFDEKVARTVFHSLRPYGGMAWLAIPADQRETFESEIIPAANLSGATVSRSGDHSVLVREGALPGSGDWSHSEATPGNAGASQDHFVKAPLGLLWFDGSIRWHRKPGTVAVRVAGGRVFLNADPLIAVDAYTGRHLWEKKLPPSKTRDNLVALEDAVYVVGDKSCRRIDPATGEWNGEIPLPAELAALPGAAWRNVKIQGDYLVGTSGNHLLCVDRHDGTLHWQFECAKRFLDVAAGDRVFCTELMNPKRGETEGRTLAFDIATGTRLWENNNGAPIRFSDSQDYLITEMGIYAAGDGARVRDGGKDLVVAGVRLIAGKKDTFTLFDLSTGAKTAEQLPWNRRGCTELRYSPNIATTRYKANAAYIDLDTKEVTPLWNMRSACNNNLFPANGVLSVPNLTGGCTCNYTPTSLSFAPRAVLDRPSD